MPKAPLLTRSLDAVTLSVGFDSSSTTINFNLWPFPPPFAFCSAMAAWAPWGPSANDDAAGPVRSPMKPIVIGLGDPDAPAVVDPSITSPPRTRVATAPRVTNRMRACAARLLQDGAPPDLSQLGQWSWVFEFHRFLGSLIRSPPLIKY